MTVHPLKMEKGEVVIVDDIANEIVGVESLYHYVVYTATELVANAQDIQKNVLNLRPEQNELYQINFINIDGAALVRLEYPTGANRNTPHQLAEYYDQVMAPKGGYAFGMGAVYLWCVPNRYPTVRASNQRAFAITTVVYFHGWKYRVNRITASEVDYKRSMGIRVLEAESYYPTA